MVIKEKMLGLHCSNGGKALAGLHFQLNGVLEHRRQGAGVVAAVASAVSGEGFGGAASFTPGTCSCTALFHLPLWACSDSSGSGGGQVLLNTVASRTHARRG